MKQVSTITLRGADICRARLQMGMSMAQLAAVSGISGAAISKIEQGDYRAVRPLTAKKLCDAFGLPFDELFIIERSGTAREEPQQPEQSQ